MNYISFSQESDILYSWAKQTKEIKSETLRIAILSLIEKLDTKLRVKWNKCTELEEKMSCMTDWICENDEWWDFLEKHLDTFPEYRDEFEDQK